jgi:hypothetical protein
MPLGGRVSRSRQIAGQTANTAVAFFAPHHMMNII